MAGGQFAGRGTAPPVTYADLLRKRFPGLDPQVDPADVESTLVWEIADYQPGTYREGSTEKRRFWKRFGSEPARA